MVDASPTPLPVNQRRPCRVMPALVVLATVAFIPACASTRAASTSADDRRAPRAAPADFAIDLLVVGHGTAPQAAPDPAAHTTRYVLEPDRTLRVGVGPGAAVGGFPPPWGRLARGDVADLWRQIQRDHLLAEPTSPMAEVELVQAGGDPWRLRPDVPLYRVRIAAGSAEHTYWTTADESPPTLALLIRLRRAAGLDPGVDRKP